jgi:cytosine/adenosine deaminase-related metal-dependent hydrolase
MFRDLWQLLGWWDDAVETHPGPPIRFAKDAGLLDAPSVLAHVNYCDDAELGLLAGGRASVVYCPRTHQYFGHPPHRWRDMLAAGVNVAAGTDSCASSPNLDLVEDLRLLRQIAPDVPAAVLWEMATIRGARALLWDDEIGSISVGKRADFAAFAAGGDDPLEAILRNEQRPESVWIDGEKVV